MYTIQFWMFPSSNYSSFSEQLSYDIVISFFFTVKICVLLSGHNASHNLGLFSWCYFLVLSISSLIKKRLHNPRQSLCVSKRKSWEKRYLLDFFKLTLNLNYAFGNRCGLRNLIIRSHSTPIWNDFTSFLRDLLSS